MQIADMPVDRLIPNILKALDRKNRAAEQTQSPSLAPFENEFWQNDFPFVAAKHMMIGLVAVLLAPPQNRSDLTAEEPGTFRRDEATRHSGEEPAFDIPDQPALVIAGKGHRLSNPRGLDGPERGMTCGEAPRKGQVHQLGIGRNVAQATFRQGAWIRGNAARKDRRSLGLDEAMNPVGQDRQAGPRSRHGDIEQTARGVGVLVARGAVPATVEDGDMVELEPLGTVSGEQQEPTLFAAGFPRLLIVTEN